MEGPGVVVKRPGDDFRTPAAASRAEFIIGATGREGGGLRVYIWIMEDGAGGMSDGLGNGVGGVFVGRFGRWACWVIVEFWGLIVLRYRLWYRG